MKSQIEHKTKLCKKYNFIKIYTCIYKSQLITKLCLFVCIIT